MQTAYVYAITVDGIIRYFGKGHGSRAWKHLKRVRSIARRRASGESVVTSNFYDKLTEAWLRGSEISHVILHDGLSDDDGFKKEAELIAGTPEGQLWSVSRGGYGGPAIRAGEVRRDTVQREKDRRRMLENWNDPDMRKRMLDGAKEAYRDPTIRKRMGVRSRSVWNDEDYRERVISGIKATLNEPGVRKVKSENTKRLWSDSSYREKVTRAISEKFHDSFQQAILRKIKEKPGVSNAELYASFGDGTVAVRSALSKLRKKGLIERRGARLHGTWFASNIVPMRISA